MNYDKLFVGGDLSGIQKFLYNITSRHASVSLKGRSAYLRTEMYKLYEGIQKVITDAGGIITEEDKLYCSGGKFYLTTNNTTAVAEAIDAFAYEKEKEFWNEHKGQLGINISHIAYGTDGNNFYIEGHDDEKSTTSGVLWKYLNANFVRQKNQKFKKLILEQPNRFFAFDTNNSDDSKELAVGRGHQVCALTGVEFDPSIYDAKKCKIDDGGLFYLPSAVKQIEIGKNLRKKENFKTFEQYATADGGTEGDSYLGILRMDVDGMGKKFIMGFPTLAEYKDFSEKARKFFEEDIQKTFLKEKDYKEHINVIYAGGDDLFIVGRWDKVIDFAKYIHDKTEEEFKENGYIDNDGNYHYISISGGIAIVKPKFPIAKAADMAGEAEDAAKQGEKNAFTMFGRTVSWKTVKDEYGKVIPRNTINGQKIKHEFDYVAYFKDKFVEYITEYNDNYGFSRSILHKIMLYSELADLNKERNFHGQPLNYSYIWHASYYLTRYMEKWKGYSNEPDKEKQKIKHKLYEFCKELRDKHLVDMKNPRNLELLAVAARWAELLLRDNKSETN